MSIFSITFISTGIIMKLFPPKYDSGIYGFRTKKSGESSTNWDIAQKKASDYAILFGIIDFIMVFMNNNYVKSGLFSNYHKFSPIFYCILLYILVQRKLK